MTWLVRLRRWIEDETPAYKTERQRELVEWLLALSLIPQMMLTIAFVCADHSGMPPFLIQAAKEHPLSKTQHDSWCAIDRASFQPPWWHDPTC